MNRTLLIGAGVILFALMVLSVGGTWYLVLDTPGYTETELTASPPKYTTETAPETFTQTVAVRSVSLADDREVANWSVGIAYNASAGERLAWRTMTRPTPAIEIMEYQRQVGNQTYTYLRYHTDDREQFDQRVATTKDKYPNTTLVVDAANQTYRHAWLGPASAFTVAPTELPSLAFFRAIPFDHSGSASFDGHQVESYTPTAGWTDTPGSIADDSPDTYVANTTGRLLVRSSTDTVVFANLSFTTRATDQRIGQWVGDPGIREHISLSVRESVDTQLRPDWATNESFQPEDQPPPEPFSGS